MFDSDFYSLGHEKSQLGINAGIAKPNNASGIYLIEPLFLSLHRLVFHYETESAYCLRIVSLAGSGRRIRTEPLAGIVASAIIGNSVIEFAVSTNKRESLKRAVISLVLATFMIAFLIVLLDPLSLHFRQALLGLFGCYSS